MTKAIQCIDKANPIYSVLIGQGSLEQAPRCTNLSLCIAREKEVNFMTSYDYNSPITQIRLVVYTVSTDEMMSSRSENVDASLTTSSAISMAARMIKCNLSNAYTFIVSTHQGMCWDNVMPDLPQEMRCGTWSPLSIPSVYPICTCRTFRGLASFDVDTQLAKDTWRIKLLILPAQVKGLRPSHSLG
jgi:hypothetical protein